MFKYWLICRALFVPLQDYGVGIAQLADVERISDTNPLYLASKENIERQLRLEEKGEVSVMSVAVSTNPDEQVTDGPAKAVRSTDLCRYK